MILLVHSLIHQSSLILTQTDDNVKLSIQGDSGGPLTVKNRRTNQHDLVGVVSWGVGCASVRILFYHSCNNLWLQDGLYGVYAEVAKLRAWIDAKIAANGGATFCPS